MMEPIIKLFSDRAALGIETVAVLIAVIASIDAAVGVVRIWFQGPTHGARKAIWRNFGTWLLLSLEFQLAADIIRSVISPTWQDIGELGAIAVIRTFLNYFLERDLQEAVENATAPAVE
jgi:uncharacterized membrane protein